MSPRKNNTRIFFCVYLQIFYLFHTQYTFESAFDLSELKATIGVME